MNIIDAEYQEDDIDPDMPIGPHRLGLDIGDDEWAQPIDQRRKKKKKKTVAPRRREEGGRSGFGIFDEESSSQLSNEVEGARSRSGDSSYASSVPASVSESRSSQDPNKVPYAQNRQLMYPKKIQAQPSYPSGFRGEATTRSLQREFKETYPTIPTEVKEDKLLRNTLRNNHYRLQWDTGRHTNYTLHYLKGSKNYGRIDGKDGTWPRYYVTGHYKIYHGRKVPEWDWTMDEIMSRIPRKALRRLLKQGTDVRVKEEVYDMIRDWIQGFTCEIGRYIAKNLISSRRKTVKLDDIERALKQSKYDNRIFANNMQDDEKKYQVINLRDTQLAKLKKYYKAYEPEPIKKEARNRLMFADEVYGIPKNKKKIKARRIDRARILLKPEAQQTEINRITAANRQELRKFTAQPASSTTSSEKQRALEERRQVRQEQERRRRIRRADRLREEAQALTRAIDRRVLMVERNDVEQYPHLRFDKEGRLTDRHYPDTSEGKKQEAEAIGWLNKNRRNYGRGRTIKRDIRGNLILRPNAFGTAHPYYMFVTDEEESANSSSIPLYSPGSLDQMIRNQAQGAGRAVAKKKKAPKKKKTVKPKKRGGGSL